MISGTSFGSVMPQAVREELQVDWQKGAIVTIVQDIFYLDREPLRRGMQGKLVRIDEKGDVLVDFKSELRLEKKGKRWVLKQDLDKIQVAANAPAGALPGSFNQSFNQQTFPSTPGRPGSFTQSPMAVRGSPPTMDP